MTPDVSPLRLWIMRAMYLVMALGIGVTFWPLIAAHKPTTSLMTGVAWSLIAMTGLLAAAGLRHPLRMLPVLLLELGWKTIWLAAFALPRWLDGTIDAAMRSTVFDTSLGAILLLVIPWGYVWRAYVRAPAEPWRLRAAREQAAA